MHKTPLERETSNSRFYLIKRIISVTFGNLFTPAPSRNAGKQTLWCNFPAGETSSRNDAKITKTTAIIHTLSPAPNLCGGRSEEMGFEV